VTTAERAADLPAAARDGLAAALRGGEDPSQAAARFLTPPTGRHKQPRQAWAAAVRSMQHWLDDLGGRIDQIRAISPADAVVVDQALKALQQVQGSARVITPEEAEANLRSRLQSLGHPRASATP
jgi:hypothetical protein